MENAANDDTTTDAKGHSYYCFDLCAERFVSADVWPVQEEGARERITNQRRTAASGRLARPGLC